MQLAVPLIQREPGHHEQYGYGTVQYVDDYIKCSDQRLSPLLLFPLYCCFPLTILLQSTSYRDPDDKEIHKSYKGRNELGHGKCHLEHRHLSP